MKLTDIQKYLPIMYYVSLKEHGPAFRIEGPPGGGKTWTFSQFPAAMKEDEPTKNYGFRAIEGATITYSTAMGYMWPEDDPNYGKRAMFTSPYWMYTKEGKHLSEYDGGYIILDDAHLLDPELKKMFVQAAYEGVLANHNFKKHRWVMGFAQNRPEDRSGATRDFDMLITRQIRLEVTPDLAGAVQWLKTHGAMPVSFEFADTTGLNTLFMMPPKDQGPYCNPRTFTQADSLLQEVMYRFDMDTIPVDPNIQEFLRGGIGRGAADSFISYIQEYQSLPQYKEIIANPEHVRMPPSDRADLWRLQAYALAKDLDLKDEAAAIAYMNRYPEEYQTIFVRAVIGNKKSAFITLPKAKEWCRSKTALIAVITGLEQQNKER